MTVFFASGDIGGARALLPVIEVCHKTKIPLHVLDHGFIGGEIHESWHTVTWHHLQNTPCFFKENNIQILVFSSSVKDKMALSLARKAQTEGLKTIHLLDSWTGYARRMEMDGKPRFIPDHYLVMDELARTEAIKDGIATSSIIVSGQPDLASLSKDYSKFDKNHVIAKKIEYGFDPDKKLVVFVSEPVAQDQGSTPESRQYRGYTEKTVLPLFCDLFQPYAEEFEVGLLPHPRQDPKEIVQLWNRFKKDLNGGIIQTKKGRDAALLSDGLAGMASILLYEAWLIGKPVISIQPGLRFQALRMLEKKSGTFFADSESKTKSLVPKWAEAINKGSAFTLPELKMHGTAPDNVIKIISNLLGERI